MFGLVSRVLLLDEPVTTRRLLALLALSFGIAMVNKVGRRPPEET
jgi:drug/metabolite transporter (DMT)-like permease